MSTAIKKSFNQDAYLDAIKSKKTAIDDIVDKYVFFAFSNEQFEEGCLKFEDELDAGDRLVRIGGGGYCLKSHVDELVEATENSHKAIRVLIESDPDFARGAFLYEMSNHEYHINWQGDWDVCGCFADTMLEYEEDKTYVDYLREAGYSDRVIDNYREASREMYRIAEENDWY